MIRTAKGTAAEVDEQRILALLPADQRAAFLALPAAERRFLLTATEEERQVYQGLSPDEQVRYAELPPERRAAWGKKAPPPAKPADGLERAPTPAPQRPAPTAAEVEQVAQSARARAQELVGAFGAWLGESPELMREATSTFHNLLRCGTNDRVARGLTLRALFARPQVQAAVLRDLEELLPPEKRAPLRCVLASLLDRTAKLAPDRNAALAQLQRGLEAMQSKGQKAPRPLEQERTRFAAMDPIHV